MPRRVISNFAKGMITDEVSTVDSLYTLHDAYVRRPGEVVTRGPIISQQLTTVSGLCAGWTTACFHPNFGLGAVRGHGNGFGEDHPAAADGFQLIAVSPDTAETSATGITSNAFAYYITENGTGSNKDQVCMNVAGTQWLAFEECRQSVTTGSEIIFAGVRGSLFKWGGSRQAPYSTGTVSVSTTGSTLITGSGTSWVTTGALEAGQYILIDNVAERDMGSGVYHQRAFRITKVHSDTELEIETPVFLATGNTGLAYRIQSVAVVLSNSGSWNSTTDRPTGIGVIGYHDSRLIVFGTSDNDTDYNTVFNYDKFRYSGHANEGGSVSNFFTGFDLWPSRASGEVFAGIGGSARGVASMGGDMILIKAHAMFRVVTSSGLPGVAAGTADIAPTSSVAVQIIPGAENVGAKGLNAWGSTKRGIVVASSDGLYLYDGSEVSCLTDGRVARWWEENFTGNEFHVLVYEDKVIVTPVSTEGYTEATVDAANHVSLVWDMERNLFWTMSSEMPLGCGVTIFNDTDQLLGQYAFSQTRGPNSSYDSNAGNNILHMTHINHQVGMFPHSQDTYFFSSDDVPGHYPITSIITSAIPIGEDSLSEGRVNNIYAHLRNGGGLTSDELLVATTRGSIAPDDLYQLPDTEEYSIATGTEDRVHRIPVDGFEASPSCRVHLGYEDVIGPKSRVTLYSVGVDYEHSNVVS